ncbi:MAG: hypothetical protein AAGC53_09665 [Actinomycetota bacterium]
MAEDAEPLLATKYRPRSWGRLVALGAFVMALAMLGASALNPFFAAGTNNRLERRCPVDADLWVYDRSSWTPLRWSCEVTTRNGDVETIAAWDWFR